MLSLDSSRRYFLYRSLTDMRKGFNGLSAPAEKILQEDPFSGHLFVFRGRRGDLLKIVWWDGQGACLFSKRLERGRFVWPAAKDGKISVTPVQLSMLLEGIDWRLPQKTWTPLAAGNLPTNPEVQDSHSDMAGVFPRPCWMCPKPACRPRRTPRAGGGFAQSGEGAGAQDRQAGTPACGAQPPQVQVREHGSASTEAGRGGDGGGV